MLLNNIDDLIAQAMVNKDTNRLNVLRLIKTNFVKFIKDNKFGELNEANQSKILLKMVSQCEDSITQFEKAGRTDLVEQEVKQLEVLKEFAPKQVSDDDIIELTKTICASRTSVSMKDMKDILFEVQKTYPTANGKIVSSIVKDFC